MIWQTKARQFDLRNRGVVMGILNLTTDSFSDGGRWLDPDAAAAHALEMEREGAAIIDIGAESTRPGADPVTEELELARIVPVLERLLGRLKAAISIDTTKATVARAALERGAEIVNDITGLRGDPAMAGLLADSGAGAILMHMRGTPRTMQLAPSYTDVAREVREFFLRALEMARQAGIDSRQIVFDPGIGFGKTVEHNLTLLRCLGELVVEDRPLALGVSRKSFLSKVNSNLTIEERLWPTVALTALGRAAGVRVVRVHDVRPNVEALRVTEAVLDAC